MTPRRVPYRQVSQHWPIYWFVLPAVFFIGLFQYYPALSGVYYSFFRWNGGDIKEPVGFENYLGLLGNSDFWRSFRIVLIIGFFNILKMIPAVAVAIAINRCRREVMQWTYRTLLVAPMVIPGLITVLIWRSFFFESTNGYLNRFLDATHLMAVLQWLDVHLFGLGVFVAGVKPAWLGDGRLILFSCIFWGLPWVGSFAVIMYLVKLQNIPKDIFEAAEIDGIGWWTKCTAIEVPLLFSSIGLQFVFVIIGTIKDAGTILALVGLEGGPGGVVTVPALFSLRKAFIEQQYGAACAAGIVLTAVVILLKKIFDQVAVWDQLSAARRWALRLFGLVMAFMIYRYVGSPLVAYVVGAACVPWPAIGAAIRNACRRLVPARPARARARRPLRPQSAATALSLRTLKHASVLAVLALAYLPMYLMIVVSFKTNGQFYIRPAALTTPLHWDNWLVAWRTVSPALANSFFVVISSTALTLLVALSAAYFFARLEMPGARMLFNLMFVLLALPEIANLLPLFKLLINLNLVNTLLALVLVGTAAGQVFAIIWLRNFIADIPQDLFEAAEIDGASHLAQMFLVVLPLSGPILGVVGVTHALAQWNDFLLPLIVMRDEARLPVMVQLLRMNGEYIKLWGPLMAGFAIAAVPVIVLFIIAMRLFTKGLSDGAVKG